ncbi:MAG: hypothetical protein ACJZ4O_01060 [Pelagibacteraceae bacterium]
MINETFASNFLSIFALVSFFITLIVQKIFNEKTKILLDQDFSKPQAFHTEAVGRSGGLSAIISLIFFIFFYFLFSKYLLIDYLLVGFFLFFIGFLDDMKINLSPNLRLLLMIFVLLLSIILFSIKLESVDLIFLDKLLNNSLFHKIFVLLCFLFIINGANLIDGFNGLVTIHLIIINVILLIINLNSTEIEFTLVLSAQIIILSIFLLFNFPKAKMFLGDGGAYLFGSLTVLNVIKTNNLNPEISSFYFCILLFYLFFEVFFSFFRKLYLKKSPLKPDNDHLHMLSYNWLFKFKKFKNCNYLNSILINIIYFLSILPAIFFKNNGIICRYWFFLLLAFYVIFYLKLYNKKFSDK